MFTMEQAARACGGRFEGNAALRAHALTDVVIDSRKAVEGCLFVCIRGERLDGHSFMPAARAAGAACCVCEEGRQDGGACIVVDSCLDAYQALAGWYKSTLDVRTVAITGSVGKTTTKELIASVLAQKYHVLKSQGNLNNQTGVPQALFALRPEHEVAVVELGTNHFGEIARLARMVRPDLCFLTNIGDAHIEHLGSREGILRAKCEMLDYMAADGRIFVNGDDALLRTLRLSRADVTSFGLQADNDIAAENVRPLGLAGTDFTACFDGERMQMHVPAPGGHMVYNALAALAAGRALGVSLEDICRGIEAYAPLPGRMCIERCGALTILNDVYNANPGSVKAALDVLAFADGRRVCVLGDMLELGDDAPRYHREVGAYAAQKEIERVVCVGTLAKQLCAGARAEGAVALHFATQQALLEALPELVLPGDTVLVKASRGMALEKTVEALRRRATEDERVL